MKQLRLSDDILLSVEKPARYIGNEINVISKDLSQIDIRFAISFPDVYEIGMSHLGLSILYDLFNRRQDVYCERVFSPWHDLEEKLRENEIPLFTLETQEDVKNFDFLGFTLQYEMSYTNLLNLLDLANIPLFSKERTEKDPIVCAGGPCTYNPEPVADFVDFFYIGEGEVMFGKIFDLYKANRKNGGSKEDFLESLLEVEGVYVPKYYAVTYKENGEIQVFSPTHPKAKSVIRKQVVKDLDVVAYPLKPLVPLIQPIHDRVVLELFRGCIHACRFCQAGMVYRPMREKNSDLLMEQATELIKNTGLDEISLVSLNSSDYTDLKKLTDYLIDEIGRKKQVNLSLPSLRIDSFSLDIMQKVQDLRKSSVTFAPEAGTQRLRDVINKGLSEEAIINGSKEAFKGGWSRVKLYFMMGLPTETIEDVEGIAQLGNKITDTYFSLSKESRKGRFKIVISTSFFVPKAFTPFQWAGQDTYQSFIEKRNHLNKMINKKHIQYNSHDAKLSMLEGVMARGDRRVGQVIYKAWKNGARFDAWSEFFDFDHWIKAFEETQVEPSFYATRKRDKEEIFPWDFIDIGVTKAYLWREYERGLQGKTTPNCRKACVNCGMKSFDGGFCSDY